MAELAAAASPSGTADGHRVLEHVGDPDRAERLDHPEHRRLDVLVPSAVMPW